MDAATKSLDHILKSGEYSVVNDVPVFDEHEEYDADGKLIRKFGRKELQKIVDECNRRAKSTGDLSPFGPGHTIADAPEHLQPVTYGYATDYKVGNFGPEKKLGILVNFHVKKTVTTPDGKSADGMTEFKSYPRRSIELWLRDGFVDHIALLRRTPQRDLGLLAFGKPGEGPDGNHSTSGVVPSLNNLYSSAKKDYSYAAAVRGGKLCYAMEPDMPMDSIPAMPPAAGAASGGNTFIPGGGAQEDDADYQQFCKNADRYMSEKYGDALKKYEKPLTGDPNMPAGDPTIPPTLPDDKDDVVKMSRQFSSADPKVQVAMFQRMANYVATVNQRLAAVETSAKDQAVQFSKEDASNRMAMLVGEGFVMDADDQADFEQLAMGAARDKKMEKVRRSYQRDMFNAAPPVRGEMFHIAPGRNGSAPKQFSKQDAEKVREHALAKDIDYATARRELYPDSN